MNNVVFENLSLKKCNQLLSNVAFYEKQIEALEMMLNDVIVRFTNKISFDKKLWYTKLFEEKKESIILMRLKLENARLEMEHAALVDIDKEELESYNQIQKMGVEVYNLEKEINELSKSLKLFLIDIL
jgi:hypothetical protein